MNAAAIDQFRRAMAAAGLTPPDEVHDDGILHRFSSSGRHGDDSGWYVFYNDDNPAGAFGCWRAGTEQKWCSKSDGVMTPAEREAHRKRLQIMRAQRDSEVADRHRQASATAINRWGSTEPCDSHPYLSAKGVKHHGARLDGGTLVVPMCDASGMLHSLQFIDAVGNKRFLYGGRMSGCYFPIGKPTDTLIVCEGFATGATLHEATGHAVAVAFNAGNLKPVAQSLREKLPNLRLILAADDDWRTEGNPGITKATDAARSVCGDLAVPRFPDSRGEKDTDFNDLAKLAGPEAVRVCVDAAVQVDTARTESAAWPDPQPLAAKFEPEPYPLDALPDSIRLAVEEVAGFVKAPMALVASSALAALSLACQAQIDAKRAEKLHGPVGLFLLTIADSGERKSTCDAFFTAAIRQYQEEQAEAMKPAIMEYQAAVAAWDAERDGILSAVKDAGKKGKPTDKLRADLSQLQQEKPEPPRVPKLILGDETPENLSWSLAKHWPSAGVLSSEAGVVFGSHGMGKDSVMRNLGLLNILWDGGAHSIGRRTSESFTVRGARLTMGLMIQETTLREYFRRSGGLARGTGFLARFLVAWPESTQGQRRFTEAPENWPHLAAFHRRITAILNQSVPIDEDGALTPAMVSLASDAKAAWVTYHDAIEGELASGGELYDVRDVASKSADNAARLAALFQMFEPDMGGAIGLDSFERASRIAAWHLSEARRFFGELALPAELSDAARLDSWLTNHCRQAQTHSVKKNDVRQYGPLRDGGRLDAAIAELANLDRLRLEKDGKRLTIHLNPALMGVVP